MTRAVRLRRWQKRALDALEAHDKPDFMAVATPGAGKTTFALTAAVRHLGRHRGARLVVVVPTSHLKIQWSDNASEFGLHLDPSWSSKQGSLPDDVHGIVVTYQQVASSARALRKVTRGAFVIFDEIHHAGDERAWGEGLRVAFEPADRRLLISGTPFRSDQNTIPFVSYDFDEATADFTYGYADALTDGGVVRPVYFPRIGGDMEWTAPDGSLHRASFDDHLDKTLMSQRLRTALSPDGEWLRTVLSEAHEQLSRARERHPDAGGLVIATDVEHARAIAKLIHHRTGVEPIVATSEDDDASSRIADFAAGTAPWIVAVRMVSEGVDIPRLRVGVFATTTTTELFFRQAVGRLVRFRRGQGAQKAWMFLPDDPRLRLLAAKIAEDRTHSLKRRPERDPADDAQLDAVPTGEEQMSLFQALAATPSGGGAHLGELLRLEEHVDLEDTSADDDPALVLELMPPPLANGSIVMTPTRRIDRAKLRKDNADRVQMLSHLTGRGHRELNAELNKLSGITAIGEASVAQLSKRLSAADRLIAKA